MTIKTADPTKINTTFVEATKAMIADAGTAILRKAPQGWTVCAISPMEIGETITITTRNGETKTVVVDGFDYQGEKIVIDEGGVFQALCHFATSKGYWGTSHAHSWEDRAQEAGRRLGLGDHTQIWDD